MRFLTGCLAAVFMLPDRVSADYQVQFERELMRCQSIDERESRSGMWLNAEGQQAYYLRARCFDSLALRFRQPDECREVREKWALLSSTWYYTEARCRERVTVAIEDDRRTIEKIRDSFLQEPVRLSDFTVELNGNGRDYDFLPTFNAHGYAGSYQLSFYIVEEKGDSLLATQGFRLKGGERIRMFEWLKDLQTVYPGIERGLSATVRAELAFDPGDGTQQDRWRPDMIEAILPRSMRVQVLERQVTF